MKSLTCKESIELYEGEKESNKLLLNLNLAKLFKCKFVYKNNDVYEGSMKVNEIFDFNLAKSGFIRSQFLIKEGYGYMTYSNGDKYIGEWKNDKKDGLGVLTSKNGSTFDASWSNDEMYGAKEILKNTFKCKYMYKSGELYEGSMKYFGQKENLFENFKLLKKHGRGTLIDCDGNIHEGDWKEDKKNGYGSIYYKNGNIFEGYWLNDERFGYGTFYFANGKRSTDFYDIEIDRIKPCHF